MGPLDPMKQNPSAAPADPVLLFLAVAWLADEAWPPCCSPPSPRCTPSPSGGPHRPLCSPLVLVPRRLALSPMSVQWALHLVPSGASFHAGAPGVDSHQSEAARLKGITKGGVAAPPFASPPSLLVAAPLQNLKRSIASTNLHEFPPCRHRCLRVPFMERNTDQPPHHR